ncbi:MAG: hypothetical protein LBV42_00505 [Methanobrevibacter sp.]|jgi:hypothetical protein|nr:hypothetical protein [Methanobrevibacter sp.]
MNISPDIVKGVFTRKEFYRITKNNLLISDVQMFGLFHENRNRILYVYEENIADEILEVSFEFLPSLKDFILEFVVLKICISCYTYYYLISNF